ncbi:MAG TPA: DUF695 domain-containing protein [Candidatus Limnocylindrales bacterium]|nr:DUF695 domain-containing protein [Candidatus Limnocylindrales bacterium]
MFSKTFNKNKKPRKVSQSEDTYSIAEMKENGKTYLLRVKDNQWKYAKSGKYPYQIGIATSLYSDNKGFPSKEENEKLLNMEIILENEFANDDLAIFVGTIMGEGMKEFIFYTGNYASAAKIYERLRDEIKHHKLQCTIQEDSHWNTYRIICGKQ